MERFLFLSLKSKLNLKIPLG